MHYIDCFVSFLWALASIQEARNISKELALFSLFAAFLFGF
jgi:hypothetical protein